MALIYDIVDQQELLGFVRNLQFDQFTLDQFLPNRDIDDIEYVFRRGTGQDEDAAGFRAFDAESPIGSRAGRARVRGELPPISKKISVGEEERLRLRQLQTGNSDPIVAQIYDDAANMTRAVQARLELARGQLLSTGTVTISENGLEITVDFGLPAGHNVNAATVWSTHTANDIIEELISWVETYSDSTGGLRPAAILTSRQVLSNMLRNDAVRNLAATVNGAPALVSRQTLNQVLAAYDLPPIITYETQVRVDGVATRVIPQDRLIFVPPSQEPLGNTFYGVTAEALELQSEGQIVASQAPGIVAVVEKTFDPVRTWTKAAGIGLPVLANPELLFIADVL